MASTVSNEASLNSFRFDAIGVAMALQTIIPNLFKISTAYFPCSIEIPSVLFHTSMHHAQVLYIELDSKYPSCISNEFLFFCQEQVIDI